MELGPENHNGDGLLGPNSIMVVYMDPLGVNLFQPSPRSPRPYYYRHRSQKLELNNLLSLVPCMA